MPNETRGTGLKNGIDSESALNCITDIVVAETNRQLTAAEALDQIAAILVCELTGDLFVDDGPDPGARSLLFSP